jgi:hypothetical protein
MLLTIPWTATLLAGACDLDAQGVAIDEKRTSWNLARVGMTVDGDALINARIMCFSMLFFFIVQGVCFAFVNQTEVTPELIAAEYPAALTGFVVCILALIAYFVFQIRWPHVTQKRLLRKEIEISERRDKLEGLFVLQHFPGVLKHVSPGASSEQQLQDHVHANLLQLGRVWKQMALAVEPVEYDFAHNVAEVGSAAGVRVVRQSDFSVADEEGSEEEGGEELADLEDSFKWQLFLGIAMMCAGSFVIAIFSDPLVASMR